MADPTPEERAQGLMDDVIRYHLNTTPLTTKSEQREIQLELVSAIRGAEVAAERRAHEKAMRDAARLVGLRCPSGKRPCGQCRVCFAAAELLEEASRA